MIINSECGRQCFVVGGPFIAEDPDCPVHGQRPKCAPCDGTGRIWTVCEIEGGWNAVCLDCRGTGKVR